MNEQRGYVTAVKSIRLPLPTMCPYLLRNLTLARNLLSLTGKQNHSSPKASSFQTSKISTAIRLNRIQVCPSVRSFAFAVLFIKYLNFLNVYFRLCFH